MSKIDPNKPLPTITDRSIVAKSRFFNVEQVDLTFSNGATRQFERMAGNGHGAVMIVPFADDEHILLIREYGAGTHAYELGFPKGLIDAGETPFEAANRELKEEAGFGAHHLSDLMKVSMAPTFFNARMHVVVARDLYPETLEGDEPEPLEVVKWPLAKIDELLARDDFTEARSIAALLLVDKQRRNEKIHTG